VTKRTFSLRAKTFESAFSVGVKLRFSLNAIVETEITPYLSAVESKPATKGRMKTSHFFD
jgi:hypothetical protein